MISTVESPKNADHSSSSSVRRKPLQLLTGIFCRKNRRDDSMSNNGSDIHDYITDDTENDIWASSDGPIDIPEPREALHSPYHARTIDQEMENLRLSRQDNPYLQVLASRECLNESDDCSEYEEKHLMSKENMSGGSRDPLTIAEVHARLVRSPPPVMWTRSRNSEPSFSHLTSQSSVNTDCVFRFPPVTGRLLGPDPSPTHSCRSHHSSSSMPGHKLLGPFEYNARIRDNTLEAVTGKFNLSPQPRRRPENKARPFTDFS